MASNIQAQYQIQQGFQKRWLEYMKTTEGLAKMMNKRLVQLPASSEGALTEQLISAIKDLDNVLTSNVVGETEKGREHRIHEKVHSDYERIYKKFKDAQDNGILKKSDKVLDNALKRKPKLYQYLKKNVMLDEDVELIREADIVLNNPSSTYSEKKLAYELLTDQLDERPSADSLYMSESEVKATTNDLAKEYERFLQVYTQVLKDTRTLEIDQHIFKIDENLMNIINNQYRASTANIDELAENVAKFGEDVKRALEGRKRILNMRQYEANTIEDEKAIASIGEVLEPETKDERIARLKRERQEKDEKNLLSVDNIFNPRKKRERPSKTDDGVISFTDVTSTRHAQDDEGDDEHTAHPFSDGAEQPYKKDVATLSTLQHYANLAKANANEDQLLSGEVEAMIDEIKNEMLTEKNHGKTYSKKLMNARQSSTDLANVLKIISEKKLTSSEQRRLLDQYQEKAKKKSYPDDMKVRGKKSSFPLFPDTRQKTAPSTSPDRDEQPAQPAQAGPTYRINPVKFTYKGESALTREEQQADLEERKKAELQKKYTMKEIENIEREYSQNKKMQGQPALTREEPQPAQAAQMSATVSTTEQKPKPKPKKSGKGANEMHVSFSNNKGLPRGVSYG